MQQVVDEDKRAHADKLKSILRVSVKMVGDRKRWAEVRSRQVKKLEELQKKAVKLFDAGELDEFQIADINNAIKDVQQERISEV